VFVFHEPLPARKLAGYALIWLALYTLEGALTRTRQRGTLQA
jgi:EamA domain-containing membrane protein RarD